MIRAVAMVLAIVAAAHGRVGAQTLTDRGYQPVDQITEDIDPLSRSLRRLDPGLAEQGGPASRVYRRAGHPHKLYYVEQGFTAEYDRSSYSWFRVTKKEWKLFQLIPPNTVFHLGLPRAQPQDPPARPNLLRESARVAGEASSSRETGGAAPGAGGLLQRPYEWQRYTSHAAAHRSAVLEALEVGDSEGADTAVEPAPQLRDGD
jgi:hypothetical protein